MQNNDILNELSTNFIEYAVAVNTDRAIPDATSGLKPVHRRILWGAYEKGYTFSKPHVKSAKIVGCLCVVHCLHVCHLFSQYLHLLERRQQTNVSCLVIILIAA